MPKTKSTAKRWAQSKGPNTAWRDRGTARLPDGTSKPVDGYGRTAAEATAKLHAKIAGLEAASVQAETITVAQLFAEYVTHKRAVKGNKAKTIYDDLEMFKRNVQPAIGATPLAELTLPDIQRLQSALTGRGLWRSAERCTILIKALLGFAAKRYRPDLAAGRLHLVMRDDVDNIKRPPGATRAVNPLWSVEQVRAFLALSQAQYDRHPRNIMFPLFYTALEAGLRRGELVGMRRSALHTRVVAGTARHFLSVTEQIIHYGKGRGHHDTPKTPASVRIVAITDHLAELLTRHMARMDKRVGLRGYAPNDLMFPSWSGGPLTPRNIYRSRDDLIKKLGFTPSTLHEMRKASNTHFTAQLLREGIYSPKLVSKRLGHTSDAVGMKIYTLVSEGDYMGATLSLENNTGMYPERRPNEEDAES